MYLESSNIDIFPASNRGENYNFLARAFTEFNLTSIVNRLVNKDGFVISENISSINSNQTEDDAVPFEFNVGGYYFRINDLWSFVNDGKFVSDTSAAAAGKAYCVSAFIKLNENAVSNTVPEVKLTEIVPVTSSGVETSLDTGDKFNGVRLSVSELGDAIDVITGTDYDKIEFTYESDVPTGNGTHKLDLFIYVKVDANNGTIIVPHRSLVRFNNISVIDDGILS